MIDPPYTKNNKKMSFLWLDLRQERAGRDYFSAISPRYGGTKVQDTSHLAESIRTRAPLFLCFDYDLPTTAGRAALHEAKLRHPCIPILMLTEHHSEELAVWALRTRVWDYLVKPIPPVELEEKLGTLFRLHGHRQFASAQSPCFPLQALPVDRHTCALGSDHARTAPAIAFITANISQKIGLQSVAAICHLSPFQFSRLFTREQGVTFQEYVNRYRISRAKDLLSHSSGSTKEIAYAVGFNEPSYFAKVFRKMTGVSPSEYRNLNGMRAPLGDSCRQQAFEF